ncbi:MAG: hypothetical protein FWF96_04925 [Kiritimatiellaeota bacterium]|nr:hypothetical protein [Kiritimatiellota bacterium]
MKIPKVSERAQVVLILGAAVLVLALAFWFLLWPQFEKRVENMRMRAANENNPFAKTSIEELKKTEEAAKRAAAALDNDWADSVRRLTALSSLRTEYSHIGFQVEYAAVRKQLGDKARTLKIALPPTFDIAPAVTSHEVVRERLNQLKTVEKLLDLVFNQHIRGITRFKNLPTVLHYDTAQQLICEEYPVEVDFTTPFNSLFYLFSGIFEEERVFVFSKIRVTSDPKVEDVLHIRAVMSSLIFP